MVRLRPFKKSDVKKLLPWLRDERVMAMWCAGIYQYPLTAEQLTEYIEQSDKRDSEWVMAGVDEEGEVIGHLCMWADFKKNSLHLGMIVVDDTRRGQGLGRQMVEKAAAYAFQILEMDRVTLGVFDCNPQARACYEKAGFAADHIEERAMEYKDEVWARIHMALERKDRCPTSI